jgi:transcription initiation factor IIF auxiliary subunit
VFKKEPFRVSEDGWGEFEMNILLTDLSGKTHTITHDLNFQQSKYEVKHVLVLKNPKSGSDLYEALRSSGPVPGDANGDASGKKRASEIGAGAVQKKKKGEGKGGVDMDKLADGLQKLGEDDLLQVVQMVHDNKTEESWMRNDVEQGEFHVDLYTLPDNLIDMLWKFSKEKGVVDGGTS